MSNKFAFVFPGQGSQRIGMLAESAQASEVIEKTFTEASDILGYDLWQLAMQGPDSVLNQTDKTQPALLTAGVALWRLWLEEVGSQPSLMAGHSLGEYTALVCAGSLNFSDAVLLVKQRGEFMQQAVKAGSGAMAAILGLTDEAVVQACEQAAQGEIVAAVNYNCPKQVVIAGQAKAVERAITKAKELGARRAVALPVSVPSHCELMKPAAEKMAAALQNVTITLPEIPVVQNVTAQIPTTIDELKENLLTQLYNPVLWTDTIIHMVEQDIEKIIECGPGKVLSGLNKKIHKPLSVVALEDIKNLASVLEKE